MFTAEQIERWKSPTAEGFFAFIEDVEPMIPSSKGGFEVFKIEDVEIRREIEGLLEPGKSTLVACWPRRHGKTVVIALIIVWRFVTRITQTIAIVANSKTQTVDTAFKLVKTILEQTPYLRSLSNSGAIVIQADKIEYRALGNVIQGFAANVAALYGKKLSVAQVSELHAANSDEVYQALASATIDTDDGVVLVDSTVGPTSSPLHVLYQLWKKGEDETIAFSHIEYKNLEEAIAKAPRWISPARLKSRAKQMLPMEFAAQHLNQWASASSALFPDEIIKLCSKVEYPLSVKAVANGRAYATGAGLDRAYGFSFHGDKTVTCAVMKLVENEEEHFYVLASDDVKFSSAAGIKKNLTRYRADFEMSRAALESYNVQDIQAWAEEQPFDAETVWATAERQSNVFTAFYNAASESRLHIHPKFKKLLEEMGTFEYRLEASNGKTIAKFEHAKGCNDDFVYALAWAIYALREVELNPYELNGVWCDAPSRVAQLCILNGGALEPACASECRSFIQLRSLYDKAKTVEECRLMSLPDFMAHKVTNIGTRTMLR